MRTAIYCRVSTPGQRNTTGLPEQERINRAYAASLGWDVSEPHVYREVEGGEDLYRPQMDSLWDAIMRHEVDALWSTCSIGYHVTRATLPSSGTSAIAMASRSSSRVRT
jgi:DNA invertase Pin-like site-specific DNA recombinase